MKDIQYLIKYKKHNDLLKIIIELKKYYVFN